jgi:membrane-bound lytic murein transglycosylase B
MPATWRAYGLGGDIQDPRDAILGAANYLRANGARRDEEPEGEERIALGVLPPAIGAPDEAQEEEAPKPRRRARKPRAESNDDEIAPAA